MAVNPEDLAQYTGAKVVVIVRKEDRNEEVEGTVDTAMPTALLLKPKGRTNLELIEPSQIEEISFAPEKPKELKPKRVAKLKFGQARQHLLDRHGEPLTVVNEMTEEAAWEMHNEIDHVEENLGHWHGEKDDKYPGSEDADEAGDTESDDENTDESDDDESGF
jgi:hypothetical protein